MDVSRVRSLTNELMNPVSVKSESKGADSGINAVAKNRFSAVNGFKAPEKALSSRALNQINSKQSPVQQKLVKNQIRKQFEKLHKLNAKGASFSKIKVAKKELIDNCLQQGILPEKPSKQEQMSTFKEVIKKMADECVKKGQVTRLSGGSGGVYKLSYNNHPLFVFKPDDEGAGGQMCDTGVEFNTSLRDLCPIGTGSVSDALAASTTLSKRVAFMSTLENFNGNYEKEGFLCAYVSHDGTFEDLCPEWFLEDQAKALEQKLTEEGLSDSEITKQVTEFKEKNLVKKEKLQALTGLKEGAVHPLNGITEKGAAQIMEKLDSASVVDLMVEDWLFANPDANVGNVVFSVNDQGQIALSGIDKEQAMPPTNNIGDQWNPPCWKNLPQAKEELPKDVQKQILDLNPQELVSNLKSQIPKKEIRTNGHYWSRCLARQQKHVIFIQQAIKEGVTTVAGQMSVSKEGAILDWATKQAQESVKAMGFKGSPETVKVREEQTFWSAFSSAVTSLIRQQIS